MPRTGVRRTAVAVLVAHVNDMMLIQVFCRLAKVLSTKAAANVGSASSGDVAAYGQPGLYAGGAI